MIDPNDIRMAWQMYLGLGVAAMLIWLLLLRGMRWRGLQVWLFFAATAFLYTPVQHPEMAGMWVPANTAAVLAWIGEGLPAALPALIALATAQTLAAALALIVVLVLKLRSNQARSKGTVSRQEPAAEPAD